MLDRAPRILLVDDEQSIQTLLSYPPVSYTHLRAHET